jgi:hypothetical protein
MSPIRFSHERGWHYSSGAGHDWTIAPPGPAAWKLGFHDPGSVNPDLNMGGETTWSAAIAFAGEQAIFLAALPPAWLRGEKSFELMRKAARLGNTALGDLAGRSVMVPTADAAFDARFSVVATDAPLATRYLNDNVRRHVLKFAESTSQVPRITWSPGQLAVRLPREITQQATLDTMITLGEALVLESAQLR